MKIDILQGPPTDLFKNRRKFIIIFCLLLTLTCFGILMGAYAIFFGTTYYDQLETLALIFFAAPAPFIAFIGEKLQRYKKLIPPQYENLATLIQQYPEIKTYCDLLLKSNRQPVRVEYEAFLAWEEEIKHKTEA